MWSVTIKRVHVESQQKQKREQMSTFLWFSALWLSFYRPLPRGSNFCDGKATGANTDPEEKVAFIDKDQ
jgi:hypothetical protein